MKHVRNTVIVFLLMLPMFSSAMEQQQRQEQGRHAPHPLDQFEIAFLRAFCTTLQMNALGNALQWSDRTTSFSSGAVVYLYSVLASHDTMPMIFGSVSGVMFGGLIAYILRHLNNEPSQSECQMYLVENTDR